MSTTLLASQMNPAVPQTPVRNKTFYMDIAILTPDEWLAVLKLSSLWEMDRIRNDAITNLPALLTNPAQKLGVAIDYNIEFWLVPAMQELVQREAPLSVDDLGHIGIECALRLAAIREACLPNNCRHNYTAGRIGIAPESRRGAVTYDCQERIEHDFKGFITIPPLKYDKALTAAELVEEAPPPVAVSPQMEQRGPLRGRARGRKFK